ncbi:V-type ATP synthase subunit E [Methanococcus voltae]|jgi:V/A-type H+-transporting ATPase subunit E|uniref:A-type ATP synthase subunit E n=1 Tax=Methanococcus voltae (strain ATCC BAA-1334 / A3) TaxID=456320 RepID=D7DRT8_METV3|nr:V-type proton ATPase subunit E [Methanococcus voltae]MCS3901166.1 V/A-type H+-transporting ATPase subunit E [Methanococcus voltae]
MGAEKITSKIKEDAKIKADSIVAEAQANYDATIAEAKEEAEKRKQAILRKGEKESEMAENRILADARLSSKKKLLEERENTIQMTIEKLEEDLMKLPQKDEYKDILTSMVIKGVLSIGGGELVIEMNKNDFELIGDETLWKLEKEVEEKLNIVTVLKKGEPIDIIGGCIVKSADGTKVSDNSLESTFNRNIDSVRAKIADLLF